MKVCLVWLVVLVGFVQAQNEWFLGTWTAQVDGSIYTLENKSDGTYYFSGNDGINLYEETGTWELNGTEFTQNWTDQSTGQPTSATYTLEKLSDTTFNQSGGNLGAGFIFSFTKVSSGGLTASEPSNPLGAKPGTQTDTTTTTDPLEQLEDILTDPGTEPGNPLDPQTTTTPEATTPNTTTPETAPEATAPPPAVDPTVTAEFLVGDWVARERSSIFTFNVRNDGTYTWQISNWKGEVSYSEEAQWSLEQGRLKQTWQNQQTGLTEISFYEPERVSDNSLRWRGGNFGLHTLLFQRILPDQISPVSSWLIGYWTSIVGIDSWGIVFQSDGTYTLTTTPFTGEAQTFKGNWNLDKETLTLTGDKAGTYTLSYSDDLTIYLSGQEVGDSNLFQKANQEPRSPYQLQTFAGQYIQATSTLTLSFDGTKYTGTWLQIDQPYKVINATVAGDTLSFTARGTDGKEYAHSWQLDNNGLHDTNTYNFSSRFFQKVSETTWNTPNELISYWIQTENFSTDDDLLLLPDGRYRQSSYFELVGETSQSVTEGLYKLENNQLILDPTCSGPSTYTVKQVENHLLQSFVGFDGSEVTTTYIAAPATAIEYQLAQVKLHDEIEAKINAEWEQKITLAPVNTTLGRIPPSGEISADPFPEDIFANSTVFAEQQLYPYTSDYYYVYDTGGNYIQTSLNSQIIENMNPGGVKQDIDFSRGSYYDKLNRYFFPNGRTLQYYESYSTAKSIAYPPQPTISYSWSKYKIENGKIIVGDDAVVYELINGRRHIRFEEECFENLKFSTANLKN
jgi:hypothetical protein